MSEDKTTTVNLPATATKGFGRGAQWEVIVDGFESTTYGVSGYGPTVAKARANASEYVLSLLSGVNTDPAFARDDDGSLIVVIPHGKETRTYRITDAGWAMIGVNVEGTPIERVSDVHHWTVIPPR